MAPGHQGQQVGRLVDRQAPRSIFSSRRAQVAVAGEALGQRGRAAASMERGAKTSVRGRISRLRSAPVGALRLGVEAAQALDGVAEELDAHRRVAVGREQVEDPAAARHLPGLVTGSSRR